MNSALISKTGPIRAGHFVHKQVFCCDPFIAWSHCRRYEVAERGTALRPTSLLDYGCGDGTFLAMPLKGFRRLRSAPKIDRSPVEDRTGTASDRVGQEAAVIGTMSTAIGTRSTLSGSHLP